MRISDWSSDVCSSDLSTVPDRSTIARAVPPSPPVLAVIAPLLRISATSPPASTSTAVATAPASLPPVVASILPALRISGVVAPLPIGIAVRSEERGVGKGVVGRVDSGGGGYHK